MKARSEIRYEEPRLGRCLVARARSVGLRRTDSHREDHGVKIGDAKIGIQIESSEKLPSAVGVVPLEGGVLALVVGVRKT